MHCVNPRILIVGAAILSTAACASREEWASWREQPAHFASGHHMEFSLRNRHAPPLLAGPRDLAAARAERWWGGPFPAEPGLLANVEGRWVGVWTGRGVMAPRISRATATFAQTGRLGAGRLLLEDTLAADVPEIVKWEGMRGIRVALDVGADAVVVRHEADARLFRARLSVDGDRLEGRVEHRGAPVRLVLERRR